MHLNTLPVVEVVAAVDAGAKLNEVAALLTGAAKFGKLDGKLNPDPKLLLELVVVAKLLPKLNCGSAVLAALAPKVNPAAALDAGALKVLAGAPKELAALKLLAGAPKALAGAAEMPKVLACVAEGALNELGCGADEKRPVAGVAVVVVDVKANPGLVWGVKLSPEPLENWKLCDAAVNARRGLET